MEIPRTFDDIDSNWLTEALNTNILPDGVYVKSHSIEPVGIGKGFMNQIARYRLNYSKNFDELPDTVIIKLPSREGGLMNITRKLGDNIREILFYESVAPLSNIKAPNNYYSSVDWGTSDSVLILEDLSNLTHGDSVKGCSLSQIQEAVRTIAKFQARWWNSQELDHVFSWMPSKLEESDIYQQLYTESWNIFCDKAQGLMPTSLKDIGSRVEYHIANIKSKLTASPTTINHGDYRLDNCFIDTEARDQITVFDWEFCVKGRGTYDVATFLCEALTPYQRSNQEIELIRIYHSTLLENNITDYPFADCFIDYRLSMLEIFVFWVIVGAQCNFEGVRERRYLINSVNRLDAAIKSLKCSEFI